MILFAVTLGYRKYKDVLQFRPSAFGLAPQASSSFPTLAMGLDIIMHISVLKHFDTVSPSLNTPPIFSQHYLKQRFKQFVQRLNVGNTPNFNTPDLDLYLKPIQLGMFILRFIQNHLKHQIATTPTQATV